MHEKIWVIKLTYNNLRNKELNYLDYFLDVISINDWFTNNIFILKGYPSLHWYNTRGFKRHLKYIAGALDKTIFSFFVDGAQ